MSEIDYVPSDEALKFIAFIRAAGIEDNANAEIHYRLADKYFSKDKQILIESFRGSAKALALNELVYQEDGHKTIADVQVGDKIYGNDGKLTTVIGKSEIFLKDTYEVEMVDGRVITCSGDHLWDVHVRASNKYKDSLRRVTVTTEEMFSDQWYYREEDYRNPKGREQKYYIELNSPVQYPEKCLPIDPYTLGAIIGDGHVDKKSDYARVTSHRDDIDELMSYIPYDKGSRGVSGENAFVQGILGLGPAIKSLGLNVNTYSKFIPEIYKKSSIAQRIALIQGLMDTDGTVDTAKNKSSYFRTVNKQLADDFMEVVRSLGSECRVRFEPNEYIGSYKVYIKHNTFNPFRLLRKANKVQYGKKLWVQKIKEVRKVPTVPTQCIMVDNESKLFLTTNYVVTHNSTIMEWLVIYVAALGYLPGFGEVGFIAFIGDSAENGVKSFFRNIQAKIDRSDFLRSLITMQRKTDSEMELVSTSGVELCIKGFGAATNIRGVRYKNLRPSMVIVDDITTNDAKTSEAIQNTINDNFYKAVIPALHPTRYKAFVIGTPISEIDIIHQLSKNPSWKLHRFPICNDFPCEKEDFVGAWTDRFPYEAVKDKYDMYKNAGKLQDFYQEYMLEITDLSTLLVEEDDIRWFDYKVFQKNKHLYNFYIATDFATSTKKSADYSVILVIALSSNGDWLIVDGQAKRQTMMETLEDLFRYVHRWKPMSVGMETSGQQGGFISIINDMMMQKNIWFQIAKKPGSKELGIRPIKDKVHRFVTGVQPMFKQGKVHLPRFETIKDKPYLLVALEELVNELSKFTLAGGVAALAFDDVIDTLNQFSEMDTFTPTDYSSEENETTTIHDGIMWHGIYDEDGPDESYKGNLNTVF